MTVIEEQRAPSGALCFAEPEESMGATHKRDLRSDHSIRQRRPLPGVTEKRLARDTRCDVLVAIGGALAAEQLTEAAPRSRN
jgi:hypothetical protein